MPEKTNDIRLQEYVCCIEVFPFLHINLRRNHSQYVYSIKDQNVHTETVAMRE